MGQPPVGPTCHGHKGRCLKAPKHSPVGVVACVGRTRSTQPPTPLPPQKRTMTIQVRASKFWIEISGGPNSSPAKSPFSTVPFRAQIAQIPNSPPTQAKFESPLVSSLSPPLCRTTTTKTTVALHHRTGATSSTPSSTAPGGPPTTSAAATDVPHRHRVPPHQVRFTDAVSQLTGATSPSTSSHLRPPRPLGLHQRSRPPHRSAPLPLKICIRARPANASASPSTALK